MPYFAMKSWIEMKIWGVGMLILACWGCSHSSHRVEELFYEEVNIPVDAPYLTQYIIQANLWQKGDSLFLAGFNYFTYSIDIINITEKKAVKYIPLEKQGPDPVSYVKALWVEDSLMLIKDFISFLTLDLHGRILSQKPDAELDADLQDDTYRMSGEGVHVGNFRYFYYNPDTRTFFYQLFPKSRTWGKYAIGVKFNLDEERYEALPIYYPEDFNYDFIGSTLGAPQFCQHDSLIVFNYAYSPDVYSYNEETKELNTYRPRSRLGSCATSLAGYMNTEIRNRSKYELDCARYRQLFYHKGPNVYSRVHADEKREGIRKMYLMILDSNFNPIVEYPLPECFAEDFFVSKDYIVFQIKPDKANPEEILRLAVVKLATVFKNGF